MAKKGSIKRLLLIFLVIEVALVIISGNFSRELQLVNEEGKFELASIPSEFDLQTKITEDFQRDEYIAEHNEPHEIYGSTGLYDFFANLSNKYTVFGAPTPVGTFNLLRMLLFVDLVLFGAALLTRLSMKFRPSKMQVVFEMIYDVFKGFVKETLGEHMLGFTPYIVTIFIFIWLCNMVGMIPIPGFLEPTRNLNVPLGMGIMVVLVVHATAIRHKGPWGYVKGYLTPLMPLDIIGEVAKGVSISFRLFGNILGGAIIGLVVGSLAKFVLLPVGMNMFFGLFVGTVQSFVFTMLALSYISVAVAE